MKVIKLYDKVQDRLVFYNKEANPHFWNQHWKSHVFNLTHEMTRFVGNSFILSYIQKYLQNKKSWILEGGCGMGGYVYSLDVAGYQVIGIDYAQEVVSKIKKSYPRLNIQAQDVRYTSFDDDFFSIYFSFGVIEHFYEGYSLVLKEAWRILKKGGYFIVSFPQISLLRRLKIFLKQYKKEPESLFLLEKGEKEFYQFALNPTRVIQNLNDFGFQLIEKSQFDGIKGFKDEIAIFKPFLQSIYDEKILQKYRFLMEMVLARIASHMAILVVQKL